MMPSRFGNAFAALAALGLLHCSGAGSSGGSSRDGSAIDGNLPGVDAGGDASGCANPSSGEVPPLHRPVAVTCGPGVDSGAGGACTTSADCGPDGAAGNARCLQGMCTNDECRSDTDCPTGQACFCADTFGGYLGNAATHPNACIPANCRLDSDCGSNGYCSPSAGPCGSSSGFYCHTSHDTCVDPSQDCASCGEVGDVCVYSPTVGTFTCGSAVCSG